ncbi:hypothetical protein ACQP2P_26110 [Dactylosporangium sp. CA-139114]
MDALAGVDPQDSVELLEAKQRHADAAIAAAARKAVESSSAKAKS